MSKLDVGVTGTSGFIGSALVGYLKLRGHSVFILDSLVHPSSINNHLHLEEKLDWVLHFGATKSIEESFFNPMKLYRRNMHSNMAALEIALSKNARLLYMSSYVYGVPQYLPIDEQHPTCVVNPYMGSKLLGEQMCFQFHQFMGNSIIILRGFSFYGPGQKGSQLIPSIVESIHNNKPIVVNDPEPIRDYLYISDLAVLVDKIITSGFSGYRVYNVGGGKPYRNIEVAEMANKTGTNSVPIQVRGKRRKNDILECYANIDKIKTDFQWQPEVDLPAGISFCIYQDNF